MSPGKTWQQKPQPCLDSEVTIQEKNNLGSSSWRASQPFPDTEPWEAVGSCQLLCILIFPFKLLASLNSRPKTRLQRAPSAASVLLNILVLWLPDNIPSVGHCPRVCLICLCCRAAEIRKARGELIHSWGTAGYWVPLLCLSRTVKIHRIFLSVHRKTTAWQQLSP